MIRLVLTAAILAVGGCGSYEACDPDQNLTNSICIPKNPQPIDAGPAGAATLDGPISCEVGGAGFGEPCTMSAQCRCSANFCAAQPGTTGFCTRDNCLADKSVCPAGYKCQDLSQFSPGLSLCVP